MKYKKCGRCLLNYIPEEETLCEVCKREINGEKDEFGDVDFDVCPYCEKHVLRSGEDMCESCRRKRQNREKNDDI